MAEVCDLPVEKFDGSLKAEHCTGKEAFGLMKQTKHLFNPANVKFESLFHPLLKASK